MRPHLTVSAALTRILYATRDTLTISSSNLKLIFGQNFRKGKIVSEFGQEYVFSGT